MRRIFGEIIEEGISHSDVGIIVEDELQMTDVLRPEIRLDQFVIMPNHVHAIILIELGPIGPIAVGAHRDAPLHRSARSLGSIVGQFKGKVTTRVRRLRQDPDYRVWQRNYYEHVIRDEEELNRIRQYIQDNPASWQVDRYYTPP